MSVHTVSNIPLYNYYCDHLHSETTSILRPLLYLRSRHSLMASASIVLLSMQMLSLSGHSVSSLHVLSGLPLGS